MFAETHAATNRVFTRRRHNETSESYQRQQKVFNRMRQEKNLLIEPARVNSFSRVVGYPRKAGGLKQEVRLKAARPGLAVPTAWAEQDPLGTSAPLPHHPACVAEATFADVALWRTSRRNEGPALSLWVREVQ